MSASTNYQ